MKVGIKFGAFDWRERFEKTKAKYAEVYFNLDQKEDYAELFGYLKKEKINFGFHYWSMIRGKYAPNLAFCRDGIDVDTKKAILETIDIAAEHGAHYVNYHPESLHLVEKDLKRKEHVLAPLLPVSEEEAVESVAAHSAEIKEYAKKRNVETYIETVPLYSPSLYGDEEVAAGRMKPAKIEGLSNERVLQLGKRGFPLCFDIGHAAAQYPDIPKDELFEKVYADAAAMAPYTKLVHVSTNLPPLNGTDSHNGVLEDDFAAGTFPNRGEIIEIFGVFKKYPDIWYIPEPQTEKIVENYFEIQKMLEEA